ncbi:MAG TPA: hypothetical protein VGN32_10285 [Ktedonobacterales bacterium]|jgi:Ca2+/Na+ antiporter|nr:hypothetical protein [Ktedonobacterales bacterium]
MALPMVVTILVALALLVGGVGLLLKGADWFTDGATDLARALSAVLLVGYLGYLVAVLWWG